MNSGCCFFIEGVQSEDDQLSELEPSNRINFNQFLKIWEIAAKKWAIRR